MPHKKLLLVLWMLCFAGSLCAQRDALHKDSSAFDRITKSILGFKPNTTAPPDDKITKQIETLKTLRGGFNLHEAIAFKLEEDRRKGEVPAAEMDALSHFFMQGEGKQNLDHATTWIYRDLFSHKELKSLVRFYKTGVGQKLAHQFPVIMLQSLTAAEMLKTDFMKAQKKD